MTGKEMLSEFILSIDTHLGYNNNDVQEKVIIDEDLQSALLQLKSLTPPANFVTLIDSLITIIAEDKDSFLTTPYTITGLVEIIDFSLPEFERKNRAFAYSDSDFGFFSSKSLIQTGNILDIASDNKSLLWKQMQEFLKLCYSIPDRAKITTLLNCIQNGDITKGFVINKNSIAFNSQRHHSYIYLSYLNNSKTIDLPVELQYSTLQLNSTLTLDNAKIYEQFFDVYDVLNELNQAPDIISRFLKLYHILEYLVYRVYLVDLVTRVGSSKFFVREFANSAESIKAKEKESFLKNFQKIFDADKAAIKADLDPHVDQQVKDFLKDKAIVKGFDTSNFDRIATLVYGLRCSIVHNKESEYHLTVTNSEDYQIIIPLIKQLIRTLESLVIYKIAINYNLIKYPQQQMNLY